MGERARKNKSNTAKIVANIQAKKLRATATKKRKQTSAANIQSKPATHTSKKKKNRTCFPHNIAKKRRNNTGKTLNINLIIYLPENIHKTQTRKRKAHLHGKTIQTRPSWHAQTCLPKNCFVGKKRFKKKKSFPGQQSQPIIFRNRYPDTNKGAKKIILIQ